MRKVKLKSRAISEFEKSRKEAYENFIRNRENYDLHLKFLSQADSWLELPIVLDKCIRVLRKKNDEEDATNEELKIWIEDHAEWIYKIIERAINHNSESLVRLSDEYRKHICKEENIISQLALRHLKNSLKNAIKDNIEEEANCWNCGKKAVAWRKGFPICENSDCHHKAESE